MAPTNDNKSDNKADKAKNPCPQCHVHSWESALSNMRRVKTVLEERVQSLPRKRG